MNIILAALPDTLRGPDDPDYRGKMPRRARFLAPDAARSLAMVEADSGGLTYTDILRTPRASLDARKRKQGVQPPGYSGHNFGLSIDLDIGATLRRLSRSYAWLVDFMGDHGWFCHRRDLDDTKAESWHFSWFGAVAPVRLALADPHDRATWAAPLEAEIQARYGSGFHLTVDDIRRDLAALNYAVDPHLGDAIRAFQLEWGLVSDGIAGVKTQRTLAVASAEAVVVPA